MAYIVKQAVSHGRINIHVAENHYIPQKGPRQTRKYIGVLDIENNELLLGAKQTEPDTALLAMLESKGIVYNGRRADSPGRKQIGEKSNLPKKRVREYLEKAQVSEVGRLDAFRYLAMESGLSSCLSSAYGEEVGERILSAAIFQASEAMPLYLAGEWASETGGGEAMSSASLSRLMDDIGRNTENSNVLFAKWIKVCGTPTSVIHDTTSISSYATDIDDVEWGYNRDKEQLPQINIALVVARDSQLPIWYRTVSGSIPDVSSLKVTSTILKDLGLKDFSFSLDRGYFSRGNLIDMRDNAISFTIGVPPSHLQASKIISSSVVSLESADNSILFNGRRLRYAAREYELLGKNNESIKLPGHVFLDLERRESAAGKLEAILLELEVQAKASVFCSKSQADAWVAEHAMKLERYFNVQGKDSLWTISRNIAAIARTLETAGVVLILTSYSGHAPQAVLDTYRCRDIAEKIFDTAKNGIGLSRLRTSSQQHAYGRVFVSFIAVILRALVEAKLKKSKLLTKYSVDEALAILRKIKTIKMSDGTTIFIEVPKKARLIKEAIEGSVPQISTSKT